MNLIGSTYIYASKLSSLASYVGLPNLFTNKISFFYWLNPALTCGKCPKIMDIIPFFMRLF